MNLDLEEFSVINIDAKIKFSELYININTHKKGFSKFWEAFYLVRLAGIEPAHPVPETGALSPEL